MKIIFTLFVILDEDTRVSLLKSPGVDGSDYINASFIDVSVFDYKHVANIGVEFCLCLRGLGLRKICDLNMIE